MHSSTLSADDMLMAGHRVAGAVEIVDQTMTWSERSAAVQVAVQGRGTRTVLHM